MLSLARSRAHSTVPSQPALKVLNDTSTRFLKSTLFSVQRTAIPMSTVPVSSSP
jgi:hypothetical protein